MTQQLFGQAPNRADPSLNDVIQSQEVVFGSVDQRSSEIKRHEEEKNEGEKQSEGDISSRDNYEVQLSYTVEEDKSGRRRENRVFGFEDDAAAGNLII